MAIQKLNCKRQVLLPAIRELLKQAFMSVWGL
jgi:hypothetical protein